MRPSRREKKVWTGWMYGHVLYILLVNAFATWNSYQTFYHPETILRKEGLEQLLHGQALTAYGLFTGTQYGYGFFAPNVGSQYISRFRFYDNAGRLLKSQDDPDLCMQQSLHRYSVYLEQFQRYLMEQGHQNDATARLYRRYLEASLTSLCQRLLARTENAARIDCTVYLHQPPALRAANQKPKLMAVYRKTIAKSNKANRI